MHNVYDLIADFYGNSSEWSEWLSRRFADDFIRTEAFRGATEDELYDTWNCVLTLLVYCGNVDIKMGDMRTDDFIDCFGWCSRNIADFALTYETAEQMLTVWSRLLHFLKCAMPSRTIPLRTSAAASSWMKKIKDCSSSMTREISGTTC